MRLKAHFASRADAPRARHGFIWNCLHLTRFEDRRQIEPTRINPRIDERGTTLVEVVLAGTVLAVGLSGLFGLLGTTVNVVKRGHTASGAQQNTVARLDQIRNLTWASLIDAASVKAVLNTPISSDTYSTISLEEVTVSRADVPQSAPSPSPTPTAPPASFSVTKRGTTVTISPSPCPDFNDEKLLKITVTTEWNTVGGWTTVGGSHRRELSTLISHSGSNKARIAVPTPTP